MSSPDTGRDLGADFHELWIASTALDKMAAAHTTAADVVSGVDSQPAWHQPSDLTGSTYGAYYDFVALRDAVVTMLHTNRTSLRDCATALELCVKDYRATDDAAHAEFARLKQAIPYDSYTG